MSYIHFKFVYKSAYDKVTFDGVNLTLSQLKKLIIEKSKLTQNKQLDYDLEITNADTNEVYRNDNDLINKNSRVNVKRIMRSSTAPLRAQPPKITTTTQPSPVQAQPVQINISNTSAAESAAMSFSNTVNSSQTIQQPSNPVIMSKSDLDSLAPLNFPSKPIIYMTETASNISTNTSNTSEITAGDESRQDEKAKLESILFNSMSSAGYSSNNQQLKPDANNMSQQNLRGANSWQPRMPNMIGQQIRPQQQQQLRPSYCCTICKKPGHPKSLCPEAGTLPKPEERPKFPSGIPKNKMRVARPDDKFAMLGPDGYVVPEIEYQVAQTVKKDKTPFLTDEEEEEEKRKHLEAVANGTNGSDHLNKYPPELKCPFGDHIIKDAVLVPCCGHFICCDECIKKKILNDEYVECPHKDCDQEIGSLESITPYHDIRKRVNEYLSDLKLANQRATNIHNSNGQANNAKAGQNSSNDIFLDLLLDDVKNEDSNKNANFDYDECKNLTPTNDDAEEDKLSFGAHSPLQDSKISSSEAAAAAALVRQSLNLTENDSKLTDKQDKSSDENKTDEQSQLTAALLPTPPVGNFVDNKMIQQPPPLHQLNNMPTINRPISANPIYPIQNDITNLTMQQPPPVNTYMVQAPRNQQPPMIPPNGNFPPTSMPPPMQHYQQYPNNFNPGFNPKYHNNSNNIRNMPPMQNGPPGYHHQRNMMLPPQQQYMNNQMQQNMMMNRQPPMQYPPNYPHHMQQNYNNGPIVVPGGPMPPYNVPPGIPPPGVVGNFINNKPTIMNNVPTYNTIPQQPGNPLLQPQMPPAVMPSMMPPNLNQGFPQQLPMMTEAEFYSYKERLKKEENQKRNNRNNGRRSRSSSRSPSYSGSSSRSYSRSSRSRSNSSRSGYSRSRSNSRSRRVHSNKKYTRSRSPSHNRNKYSSSNGVSNSGFHNKIVSNSSDKYYRSNKNNKRDYYRRRSNSRDNRRSKSRSKNTSSRTAVNKDYYHYKQHNQAYSRSRSRSPNQTNRYNRRSSRSRSSSPNSRYRLKSNRNNSPYRRPSDSKSVLPQVVASSTRANVSDNVSIDNSSESNLKLKVEQGSEIDRKKSTEIADAKKLASSVMIKRDENYEPTIESMIKKRRHSSREKSINKPSEKRPTNSNFPLEDDFAIKIDSANSRTVTRLIKTEQQNMEKEGSVLSSVSSDSRDNNYKKTSEGDGSRHKHKSKKKHKHKHRSPSKSSSKIQV